MIFEAKAQPIRAGAGSPVTRVLVGIGCITRWRSRRVE